MTHTTPALSSPARALAFVLCLLATTVTAQPPSSDSAHAVELNNEAHRRYQRGEYAEAADLLRAAYALTPRPILLFNLARALEEAEEIDEAAETFERYLATDATGDSDNDQKRAEARTRLDSLRSAIAARDDVEPQESDPVDPRDFPEDLAAPDTSPSRAPAWAVVGVGSAVLVAGFVCGGLSVAKTSEAESSEIHLDASNALDSARTFAIAADVLMAVGATAVTAGILWAVLGFDTEDESVTLELSPTSIGLSGRF